MMARAGAQVAIVARDKEKLAHVVKEIRSEDGKAWAYSADLTDIAACDRVLGEISRELGSIDILVNNAGVVGAADLARIHHRAG